MKIPESMEVPVWLGIVGLILIVSVAIAFGLLMLFGALAVRIGTP